jgi:hypothetical protein
VGLANVKRFVKSRTRRFSALAVGAVVLLAACGSAGKDSAGPTTPTSEPSSTVTTMPSPSGPVRVTILSTQGPNNAYLAQKVYVDTSLANLRAAVTPGPFSEKPGCPTYQCWPTVHEDPSLLYIAAQLWVSCTHLQAVKGIMSGSRTVTVLLSITGGCPAGYGSAATPPLALLGVPFAYLPNGDLTVQLEWAPYPGPLRTATVRIP